LVGFRCQTHTAERNCGFVSSVRQTSKEEEEEGGREGGDYSEKLGVRCVHSKLCQHDVHGLARLTP